MAIHNYHGEQIECIDRLMDLRFEWTQKKLYFESLVLSIMINEMTLYHFYAINIDTCLA